VTPPDIACARADGIRCVAAVTTGRYDAPDLIAADHVASGTAQLRGILCRELAAARRSPAA
jgi:hypothetical protein